ncbi:MAG: 20, gp20 [Thermoleophilia bacterium]|nr:20, gp20 [Thermoleophilia bacterium]
MALAEIGARLRLQGAAAYRRDADRAADSTSRLGREADQADRHLGRMGGAARRAGGALARIAKAGAFAGVAAAAVGVGALAAGLFQGFQDAAALQTILAKTNAVITSTGGVAKVSAKGIVNMADELESLSGVDGDAIINAQNLLLTFTKVRNGVGETNHVFDLATKAAVDMAVALGQDPSAAAMQLGKALNDPIKGVSALGKAGVSFSEDQKKTIKQMVATNRVMDAQKIILGEMQVQFGGAAKAAGSGFEGSMARAKDAIGDLFRDVATPLLDPVTEQIERFSTYVNDRLAPAMVTFSEEFIAGVGAGGRFRDRLGEVWDELKQVGTFAQAAYEKAKGLVSWMTEHETAVKTFAGAVVAVKVGMAGLALANFAAAALGIGAVGSAAAGAQAALLGPVGLVAALAIAAAAIEGFLLYKSSKITEGCTVDSVGYGEQYTNPKTGKPVGMPALTPASKPLPPRGGKGGVPYVAPQVYKPAPKIPASATSNMTGSGVKAPDIVIPMTLEMDGKTVWQGVKVHAQDEAARR